ncbi:MAG TPA: hypothetical protein VNM92_12125 [Thermoanaerobaculia bacterium]|nr:hypothetical protein [Thermoanaerobaculia bacterium]
MPKRSLEADARAALEARRAAPFDDEEWSVARERLLEFFALLGRWADRHANAESIGDNASTPERRSN